MTDKKDYSVFAGNKFIESMRSSGFKDTSYAVAEIIDNSIDAESKQIKILCKEKLSHTNRYSLTQMAILDDGHGMNAYELRSSLLFGDGTRGQNSKEIGKFGMGLPNASLSQCKRMEIYSWQNSSTPLYTYLDVDEVKKGKHQIPTPETKNIPDIWKVAAKQISKESGTLVIWSKLDRCSWTSSKKLIEHSTFLIGRIYRRFLNNGNITINLITVKVNDNDEITDNKSEFMKPNDPMYLMKPSSTPGKWGKEPMFKKDTQYEVKTLIDYEGQKHTITIRYSLEKDELRAPENVSGDQGGTKHGQHARKNTGISIIRANREISLNTDILTSVDPRDRWWGVEIDVPTSLDLVVGLTNNKQQMNALSNIMRTVSQFGEDDTDENTIEEQLSEQDNIGKQLFGMTKDIRSRIRSMQNRIRATRAGTRSSHKKSTIDGKIDGGIKQDQEEGNMSESDKDRKSMEKEQRAIYIGDTLTKEGKDPDESKKIAKNWVDNDKKINFEQAKLDGKQFFSVENTGGVLRIKINHDHRAYKNLFALIETERNDENKELSTQERLNLTKDGLWLLLASWARYEDLIENDIKRRNIQDIRIDWGRELDTFLEQNQN